MANHLSALINAASASSGRVFARWALSLVALGVIVGTFGSFAITRLVSGFLFGIKSTDPVTFLAILLVLAIIALLASYIPARRATKVDPMVALRYE